jgi:hypothetical protein
VQSKGFLSLTLVYFLLSLSVTVLIIVIREIAIRQYHLERRGYTEESILGKLGDNLSNTPSVLFSSVLIAAAFLTANIFLEYLQDQIFYDVIQIPFFILLGVLIIITILFFAFTVRGRVYLRTGSIEREFQTLGYEDLIIQKQLTDLIHESERGDYKKSEIAKQVIENLSNRENKTGDAVRRIMMNPARLRDMEGTRPVPNQGRYLRFTYILAFALAITLIIGTWGRLSGYFSVYDLIMKIMPLLFILLMAFALCFCIEGTSAIEKRRKQRYGI